MLSVFARTNVCRLYFSTDKESPFATVVGAFIFNINMNCPFCQKKVLLNVCCDSSHKFEFIKILGLGDSFYLKLHNSSDSIGCYQFKNNPIYYIVIDDKESKINPFQLEDSYKILNKYKSLSAFT